MTIGKTLALTRWTFVGKVISLLFNMLARLVITFLPRIKCLNFMAAVTICSDFAAPHPTKKRKKICHCFHCFPIYLPWSDGTKCRDLSFLNVFFFLNVFKLTDNSKGTFLYIFEYSCQNIYTHIGQTLCISIFWVLIWQMDLFNVCT